MPKASADLRSLARSQTETCIRVLTGIMRSKSSPKPARVMAANSLLDRGWGKPAQTIVGDSEQPLQVIIRKMLQDDDTPTSG